jgi:hypothetical protein
MWSLALPDQRLWASQQHQHQRPYPTQQETNARSDIVGDTALPNDTSWLALFQQTQQDNAAQQVMAAEAELLSMSHQRPLMHLSNGDLLQILKQDNRNRMEQQQQRQQIASQLKHQQLASEFMRQQQQYLQVRQRSQLPTLGSASLTGQSAHGWPFLEERFSFSVPNAGVQGSATIATGALLAASTTPHVAMMGGSPRQTLDHGLSLPLSRNRSMLPAAEMNFSQATAGTKENQVSTNLTALWGNHRVPIAQLTPSTDDGAMLAVRTEGPPLQSNMEDKPRARKHPETLAETAALSAKRVREYE